MRPEIGLEAQSLVANRGADAYRVAVSHAEEAASDEVARNWREVAEIIARTTRAHATLAAVGS